MTLENEGTIVVDKEQEAMIGDVLDGMGLTPPEPPPTEPPKADEPPPAEPPKVEEPKKEEPPKEEPPKEEPPVIKKEDEVIPPKVDEDELTRIRRENEELRKSLLEAAKDIVTPKQPPPLTPEQQAAQAEAAKNRQPIVLPFFKEDKDIDAAFKDVDSANKFMTGIVATAVEFVSRQIPTLVTRVSDQQVTTRMAVNEFYKENKDLLPYKEYCGFITNKVTAEHPDYTLTQVFEEVNKQTRAALKLAAISGEQIPGAPAGQDNGGAGGGAPKGKGPALPPAGGGGRRSGPPSLTGVEKEINDLITD